ncbi:hypothetical protein K490DRAFT_65515 [Saccharata proteae CBS 121410]|uniref:Myb/SANT-like domain-containing protein n=1 Tax=Saccharata proteae CBS 121410 TaxID=1314787 RepID=A0A9P4M091_9PEZI|nr:hypothetical protein K490DRAFT_65515 [Saccharata proteae CBS 121410]
MPNGRGSVAAPPRTDPASNDRAQTSQTSRPPYSGPATPVPSGDTPTAAQTSALSKYPGKKLSYQEEITLIRACCDLEDTYGKGGTGWVNKFWLEVSRRFKALCGRVYTAASCQRKMTQFIERRRGEIADWHAAHRSGAELPTPDEWQVFVDRFMITVNGYETIVYGHPRQGRKRRRNSGSLDDEDVMREADDMLTNHDASATIEPAPRPMPTAEEQLDDAYREAELMREVISRLRRPNPQVVTPAMENSRLDGIEKSLKAQAAHMARMERALASRLTNLEMRFVRVETELDKRFSHIEELLLAQNQQLPAKSASSSSNEEQETQSQAVDQT